MATMHPSTRISSGELIGRQLAGIDRYLGIPYAAPPFGPHRFALPQPAEPWSQARECAEFGPAAPQSAYPGRLGQILESIESYGEDILTANVWAPSGAEGLPVVLWIHGGAFERGGAALSVYDGSTFARDGVVFVSVNYRLGSEGFSVVEGAPRNLGLEDAAAALRWVHAEVAAFGGDPARITLMGESAGGALVAALLARPEAALVAGAIIESGPLSAEPPARAKRVTDELAKRLGVPATAEAFAAVEPQEFVRVRGEQMAGKTILDGVPSYTLCIDDASLPRVPEEGVRDAQVPLLIGTNSEEYRLWFAPEALRKTSALRLFIVRKVLGISRAAVREYRRAWPGANHGEVLGQLITDRLLRGPAIRVAGARRASSYVYEFAWRTQKFELGAAHALELGFVFDSLGSPGARMIAEGAPQGLADRMHADWVRFIREGVADWPDFAEGRQVRRYDEPCGLGGVPRETALAEMRH